MPFLSSFAICFLILVWLISRLLKAEYRWRLLLAASLVFVCAISPGALGVLVFSSLLTFMTGLFLTPGNKGRRFLFFVSLSLQAILLLLLKFVESGQEGTHFIFQEAGYRENMILFAAGFSFYTLQHISYLTDVYNGRTPVQTNAFRFLLFSSFFAKFSSGPVENSTGLIPQLMHPGITREKTSEGFQRIILGVFKKMVLADRLSEVVSRVFDAPSPAGSLPTSVGICLFTVQLYLDFSAYSDIALGIGKVFGIRLTENFNRPFSSASVTEFWRRWHISLMNWFKNYLYFPTVFRLRRSGRLSVFAGIWLTFLVSGIWHGIGKTFLVWSLLHAAYLCTEHVTGKERIKLSHRIAPGLFRFGGICITFLLVSFSNLFFRSSSWIRAKELLFQLGTQPLNGKAFGEGFLFPLAGGGYQEAVFNLLLTVLLLLVFFACEKRIHSGILSGKKVILRNFLLLFLIMVLGIFKQTESFIYLQF